MKVNNYPEQGKCFVHVSRDEAIELIESLAHQLATGNPNAGRLECEGDVTYFSIAVE